jgi:hypothetical protein
MMSDEKNWIESGDAVKLAKAIREYLEFQDMLAGELLHDELISKQEYDEGRANDTPLRNWLKFQEWLQKNEGSNAEG